MCYLKNTVIILGILAVLVILLERFFIHPHLVSMDRKAKQWEAKTELKTLHFLEGKYFEIHKKYSADLREIGFSLQGVHRYVIGFNGACLPVDPQNANTLSQCRSLPSGCNSLYPTGVFFEQAFSNFNEISKDCPLPNGGYKAFAVGQLSGDGKIDVWSVDQTGHIVNERQGW